MVTIVGYGYGKNAVASYISIVRFKCAYII